MIRPNREAVFVWARDLVKTLLLVAMLVPLLAEAKDKSLTGVLLYQGPSGPAYAQIADINLNGKTEVLVCTKGTPIEKNAYRKLPRMGLVNPTELERDADGVLKLKVTDVIPCVVPQNIKYDKDVAQMSPQELANRAMLGGQVIGRSANAADGMPELKPGAILYFGPANDTELAEYLRAVHWHTNDLLRMYVMQFPNGAHIRDVKQVLAGLITSNAEAELDAYTKSLETNTPALDRLHTAKTQIDEALLVVPNFVKAQKLAIDLTTRLQEINTKGREEFRLFITALAERKGGYSNLTKAKGFADDALKVDATFDAAQKLQADVTAENQKLDLAISNAQTLIGRKQFDQAYSAILRYRAMAPELPKVQAVVDATFGYHRDLAKDAARSEKWDLAISEYKRALACKEDAALANNLKVAEEQFQTERNKAAAEMAVTQSKDHADKKEFVEAYELLANLSNDQKKYVVDEMQALETPFVQDAVKRADTLMRLHLPIRGRADEDAVRNGYHLLVMASRITDDQTVKVKLDLLSDRISEYYVTQARRMFEKPRGSGVGLGWKYLQQAQYFKPDMDAAKDEMTKRTPMYEMRSKLSLGIHFRDQTSRRDSVGFADQLTDAVVASLESLGLPALKVVAQQERNDAATGTSSGLEPNFQLQCDILQHRVTKKTDVQRVQSHYRAGTRELRNPEWTQVKRDLDATQEDYNRMNSEVPVVNGKRKLKPEMAKSLDEMAAKIKDLRAKVDAIPETKLENIIQPYNYNKRTIELTGIVEFAFRLTTAGETTRDATNVKVELPTNATVMENVKSEDTDGAVEEGEAPDELQILNDTEIQAQTALIKKITEKLQELSKRVLEDARRKVSANDLDGAAESYILYLNCSSDKDQGSSEQTEARQFLQRVYNISEASGQ